jgi:hypothetical protein
MQIEFNKYRSHFKCDFTIEFGIDSIVKMNFNILDYDSDETKSAIEYAQRCAEEIFALKTKFKIIDWNFAGTSNEWLVLLCNGVQPSVDASIISRIRRRIIRYFELYKRSL